MVVLTLTVAKKVSDKNMRAWVSTVYSSNLIKGCEKKIKAVGVICYLSAKENSQTSQTWVHLGRFSRAILQANHK